MKKKIMKTKIEVSTFKTFSQKGEFKTSRNLVDKSLKLYKKNLSKNTRRNWKMEGCKPAGNYSRAIARRRGLIAGDSCGASSWRFASSTLPVCITVILCLKSSGKEIWPGAFLRSCGQRDLSCEHQRFARSSPSTCWFQSFLSA